MITQEQQDALVRAIENLVAAAREVVAREGLLMRAEEASQRRAASVNRPTATEVPREPKRV